MEEIRHNLYVSYTVSVVHHRSWNIFPESEKTNNHNINLAYFWGKSKWCPGLWVKASIGFKRRRRRKKEREIRFHVQIPHWTKRKQKNECLSLTKWLKRVKLFILYFFHHIYIFFGKKIPWLKFHSVYYNSLFSSDFRVYIVSGLKWQIERKIWY